MCGIFGYAGVRSDAAEIVLEGLKTLEYRGYDSWGVAAKKGNDELFVEKQTGKIGSAVLPKFASSIAIGHTRWATHGGVTVENAHPHVDAKKEVVVVHNGIVENFEQIKKDLLEKGYEFKSQTDTEVIVHLAADIKKSEIDPKQVALKTFKSLHGLNAIIFFFPKEEQLFAIKNGSPLIFGKGEKEYFLASDSSAVLAHTKELYFLQDHELLMMNHSEAELFDLAGNPIGIVYQTMNIDPSQALLGDYPDFMTKEMHEQPKVLEQMFDLSEKEFEKYAELIEKAFGTYFVGCGTAYYAGFAGTYLLSKIAKKHVNVVSGSEFLYMMNFIKEKSLLVAFSQSGETIDLINSVKMAKEKKASVMVVTNTYGSSLQRLADASYLLNAGVEKCVLSTKSFTAKIGWLFLVAHKLAHSFDDGRVNLKKAIDETDRLLHNEESFKQIAGKIIDSKSLFILGRGISYPAALESALKIKEVSYIHAEGFAAGELKHGVIALIEKGIPVIVYNPEDETYEDALLSAHEVKARGAYVIGVSSKPNEVFDEYIEVKNCADATVIPNVVVAQLIAYYLAKGKGLDPDKPRNLAKSVTVK